MTDKFKGWYPDYIENEKGDWHFCVQMSRLRSH